MIRSAVWLVIPILVGAPLSAQSRDCDGHFVRLVVPTGFCVRVFADSAGPVRQVVVHPTGQIVAALNVSPGLIRFRDTNNDGKADQAIRFGPGRAATGVTWRAGWLYLAADDAVVRYRWPADSLQPDPDPEWIATHLPLGTYGSAHTMKGIAVGPDGTVYVSFGSATDNCQERDRGVKSPGILPCPELEQRAGIWRFTPPKRAGGDWSEIRFATGLRNSEALAFDPGTGHLWGLTQGRDGLNAVWGWRDSLSANQPAEMLELIEENGDYGWPYCQGSWSRERTILIRSPEYLGANIDCAKKTSPVMGFAGHWAPMALAVVNSSKSTIPHPGFFIAFHGSRGRAPLPEDGHFLVFVPIDPLGMPAGPPRLMLHTTGAPGELRPSGVAVSISGAIYVTDDEHGRIYRIESSAPGKP